jgi:L-alanine-DL-glutamate epimerase-like enolase superfamily enzyme
MDWWGISQLSVAAVAALGALVLFCWLATHCEGADVDQYDDHYAPPPNTPVPRALLRGPDNDAPAPHDADTQPAMRAKRAA